MQTKCLVTAPQIRSPRHYGSRQSKPKVKTPTARRHSAAKPDNAVTLSPDLLDLLSKKGVDLHNPIDAATLHAAILAPAPSSPPTAASLVHVPDDALANAPYRWFTPDECSSDALKGLLAMNLTFKGLLDLAHQTAGEGVSLTNYTRAMLAAASKTTILEAMRSAAGSENAAGLADARIREAYESLKKANDPITTGRLKGRTGTNGKAIVRWMLLNCPEFLLTPPPEWAGPPVIHSTPATPKA